MDFLSNRQFRTIKWKIIYTARIVKNFNVEKTALIIGLILCISRIVRVISNILFNKIYIKYKK